MLRINVCRLISGRCFVKMSSISVSPKRKRISDGSASTSTLCHKSLKVTQSSIASFFGNPSKMQSENVAWQVRGSPDCSKSGTLLVGTYVSTDDPIKPSLSVDKKKMEKIAAFDFDSTLIQTKSGKVYPTNAQDWKWWHPSIPSKLRKLYLEDDYHIVIISNQAGISIKPDSGPKSKFTTFKMKVNEVLSQLNIPIIIYAATEKDIYRKPRSGIWTEVIKDLKIGKNSENFRLEESIFVGDAAGRQAHGDKKKDFSCCDRDFAENIGIRFATPEEYFLGGVARPFTRTFEPSEHLQACECQDLETYTKMNKHDIVLICGSPGAGKSSWYRRNLEGLGYTRVNQDNLKTFDKCIKVASRSLDEGHSVAVDNTNADIEVRSKWIDLAAKYCIPIRCVHLTTPTNICIHNDVVRALNTATNPENRAMLPGIAFNSYNKRFQPPQLKEGFQDITKVGFKFYGSEVEQNIWRQHWV